MARNFYGPLRDPHSKALDATGTRAGEAEEPARPEGNYQQRGWTAEGGLVQQQASANDWLRANEQARQNALSRQEARENLAERIDHAKTGQTQEQAAGSERIQDGPDRYRELKFFEGQERSGESASRDGKDQSQTKTQEGGRSLKFFEDRANAQDQDQDLSR